MLFMVLNMKKLKLELFTLPNRLTLIKFFTVMMILLMLFMTFEIPLAFKACFGSKTIAIGFLTNAMPPLEEQNHQNNGPFRLPLKKVSTLSFNNSFEGVSKLYKVANHAYISGKKLWEEVESGKVKSFLSSKVENGSDSCLNSFSVSGIEFKEKLKGVMVLPCGLTLWSHVTVVGTPRWAHGENDSQFMIELQGLKSDDNEEPPRILHFNPRLKGDWSGKPVIEQNTCYKSNWGTALRCEGWKSRADEETVDGHVKCEKWIHDDANRSEEWKATWWLNRLMGQKMVMPVDWPYPFVEGKLFVLTISAGLEGYHITVSGRHVTSFPYRTGFALEDAVGLAINGDVDVHSIYVASLPTSHPRYARQMHLELLPQWKAPPILGVNVELFIGIISAGNHFVERMAVRKSWMQHKLIKSSHVVARFFVALHGKKDINMEIKKEAEYFGDIIIVPYMDHYHLVVLKTIAICEYGIGTVAAKYIMKCDDDTFVRVDSVISEARQVRNGKSLYMGNMIYHPKPLHNGKWAVTYEEWAEDVYPIYAFGPGYIVSSDIARFIVSEFEQQKLKLFKMEDVSMGMWVEQFNSSREVEYVHSFKFCKFGCIEDYYTAHYQSPGQMECMWEKLQHQSKPLCCNMR